MKQLFWVAWVSYHHLPKVCDSLQSRMLAGLLIADMLEPLWPAAAVSSKLSKDNFSSSLSFSFSLGFLVITYSIANLLVLTCCSLNLYTLYHLVTLLLSFFSLFFSLPGRLYLFLRHVQPFTAQRRSPRLASFPSCSRCAQMGKGMSLVSCSTRTQRKFSAVIDQVIYSGLIVFPHIVLTPCIKLDPATDVERILLLLLLEK